MTPIERYAHDIYWASVGAVSALRWVMAARYHAGRGDSDGLESALRCALAHLLQASRQVRRQ